MRKFITSKHPILMSFVPTIFIGIITFIAGILPEQILILVTASYLYHMLLFTVIEKIYAVKEELLMEIEDIKNSLNNSK